MADTPGPSKSPEMADAQESHDLIHSTNDELRSGNPLAHSARASSSDETDEEKPRLEKTMTNSSQALSRYQTNRSARERQFSPIRAGVEQELHRIATELDNLGRFRSSSIARASTNKTADSALYRNDTLAGVALGDPVLDPKHADFNPYKWARMSVFISFFICA
jgi:hypothetical protein